MWVTPKGITPTRYLPLTTSRPPAPPLCHALEIRLRGRLDPSWSSWLGDLAVQPSDGADTVVRCPIADQAALHGVLARVRDMAWSCSACAAWTADRLEERGAAPTRQQTIRATGRRKSCQARRVRRRTPTGHRRQPPAEAEAQRYLGESRNGKIAPCHLPLIDQQLAPRPRCAMPS